MINVRLLLLSDIHANLAALEAVLADAQARERGGFAAVYSVGDTLGYGPQPDEVLTLLRTWNARCVLGNHDAWALGFLRGEAAVRESGIVGQALKWQLARLAPDNLAFLKSWPEWCDEDVEGRAFRVRHGSPSSLLDYVESLATARDAFATWSGRICFVGHTHLPAVYATLRGPSGEWLRHQSLSAGGRFALPPSTRVILNPGSVGQPRDGDPRASYGLFDLERCVFEVVRVPYDVARTQAAVREAGLPEVLGARLGVGK